ncbi:MAG: AgmX/PglI C-terminal domain-containing protein [Polyangiaceae bacterium]|nr:AgmX/PglI C-terminal domain-containing protein [Polyangiaceae bacterium]
MRAHALPLVALLLSTAGCREQARPLAPRERTFAELRLVRRGVTVTQPGEAARAPFDRERLSDGATVGLAPGALAWLRRDGGATLLVSGPASLELRESGIVLREGRAFVDALGPVGAEVTVPRGEAEEVWHLADARVSVEVAKGGATRAYVLRGGARVDGGASAGPGESLSIGADGKATVAPELAWDDWTGGLATVDPAAQPAPFGVGTVGAREPGASGSPRFPLAIQKLEVRVTIDGDLATTEVDEVFFNPTGATVEGLYRFRTPEGASLHRFGVDRDGELVWGRSKEQAAAAAQYQSNVYAGSTEDPALLEWDGPGVFRARLYPIAGGASRRVVTRYAEWLGRQGARGERRLYTYPMAAEGAEATLPRIEELTIKVDLRRAHATEVRAGMDGVREGSVVTVHKWDTVPRADFSLELLDDGPKTATLFRAKHAIDPETLAPEARAPAKADAKKEADYILLPVRATEAPLPEGGLDLAIVVDASAATSSASFELARETTRALLAHLGEEDRVAVWAGDTGLREVAPGSEKLSKLDAARRTAIVSGLAKLERSGATDLGGLLTDAARALDPKRRSAVVYIGDGRPTVGELALPALRARLDRLPHPLRLFSIGAGHEANMAVVQGLSRGALSVRVTDGSGAASTALRLLEEAERPAWLGVSVELGAGVERVVPSELGAISRGETALVVGRLTGAPPKQVTLKRGGVDVALPVETREIEDDGDLGRRWAEGRLGQLLVEGAGRAAVVEVGTRHGVITPFTSLYVPTKRELRAERAPEEQEEVDKADNKEGGTGTRAKGEEGSMGNTNTRRYAVKGPADNPELARQAALRDAAEFGVIGLLNSGAGAEPKAAVAASAAPPPPADREVSPSDGKSAYAGAGSPWGRDDVGDSFGAGGLGLKGAGEGGGGRGEGIGLGSIGSIGHGAGVGTGQGFGSGGGRLGGAHKEKPPTVRLGAPSVKGRLPPEVVARIARQNVGRVRLCYEKGLSSNPSLAGRVSVELAIATDGSAKATAGTSSLPDAATTACVARAFDGLSFPQPEGGAVTAELGVELAPGDAPAVAAAPAVTIRFGDVGHQARRCGAAAGLPLEERVILWRERLARAGAEPERVRQVYSAALDACEALEWRDRTRLLGLMLDALPAVAAQVKLWRALGPESIGGDLAYRFILARARTPAQLRELHDALGLRRMDPAELAKIVAEPVATARVRALTAQVARWPDDHELALRLLEALEDAGDVAGGRAFARRLRALPLATARVRTGVGEYYLRLSKKGGTEADAAEARRAFGEIVEFAPDDPVARRRLGDLLRAHGWHEEALRQYETLAQLTPDDATVPILLAAAAQGMGRVEEAVRWTEKASAGSAPDGQRGTGRTARAFAAVFLGWARQSALAAGRADDAKHLLERATRVAGADAARSGARVFVTWSHPELRPTLWSSGPGGMMPARDGDPQLGIAEVTLTPGKELEVRLDPEDAEHAARLGAEVVVTALIDEGGANARAVRLPITFAKDDRARRFRLDATTLAEVSR